MKVVILTNGLLCWVSDQDFERVSQFRWRGKKNSRGFGFHAIRTTDRMPMSRFILQAPKELMVDHEDGNTLNNTRRNLRLATNAQNQHNQRKLRKDNTSGFKGVTWSRKMRMWNSQIYVNTKRKHLGYFLNKKTAALAYDAAAIEHFGEFAATNFPVASA